MNKPDYQPLTTERHAELPAFVKQALLDIIGEHEAHLESYTDDENADVVQACLGNTLYAEVAGTLGASQGHLDKAVSFWIGGRDEVLGFIHIGGSGCWMLPDGHMIGFTAIKPDLLPVSPDPQTWWVITYDHQRDDGSEGCNIIKIHVRPEDEVQTAFSEIG